MRNNYFFYLLIWSVVCKQNCWLVYLVQLCFLSPTTMEALELSHPLHFCTSFGGFFCISCNLMSTWTKLFTFNLKPHILTSSPLCQTSNESHDKDWHNGNKWAFSGIQTHSPVCGRKEDKAFYSIYRHKTWPLGPSGQKVRVLGAESRFQQSAGRRDICPPCHIPSHLRSLKHSPALCL